jgi:hypothetical protein
MSLPTTEGKHSYDLQIKDDIHWKLVEIGASLKMGHESFVEFMIEDAIKSMEFFEENKYLPQKPGDPLYKRIQSELDLYGSIWPPKLAQMFELIADIVEYRGSIDYDRDPGETADWLRQEAKKVKELEERIIT